jgi:hypothetical protein
MASPLFANIHVSAHAIKRFRERNEAARTDTDEKVIELLKYMVENSKPTEPINKLKVLDLLRKANLDENKKVEYRRFCNFVLVVINRVIVTVHKNAPGQDWK